MALALCFWQSHLLLEIAGRPAAGGHKKLITFGVTEPFTTTLTVSAYGALILSLPFILYQIYAYVLPAFSDSRAPRRPADHAAGPPPLPRRVAFGYFAVMPAAVKFLLGFNDSQFNVQVRARDYYSFFSTTMLACGHRLPAAAGDPRGHQARHRQRQAAASNRRYAYLVISIIAAALPGVDPVSMLLEMVPLLVLLRVEYLARTGLRRPAAAGGLAKPSTQE